MVVYSFGMTFTGILSRMLILSIFSSVMLNICIMFN